MSVNAGFGGQPFNPKALEKLQALRSQRPDEVILEVDGGLNVSTIRDCAEAGADWFVVGSAIFGQRDYDTALRRLELLIS
jgi:ribulose-phosphate 3-epimerase